MSVVVYTTVTVIRSNLLLEKAYGDCALGMDANTVVIQCGVCQIE